VQYDHTRFFSSEDEGYDINTIVNSSGFTYFAVMETGGRDETNRIETDYIKLEVFYDNSAPTFTNQYNSTSYHLQNTTFNISITDTDSNVDNLTFYWNETGSWINKYNVSSIESSTYDMSVSLNVSSLTQGFSWFVRSCDTKSNCGNSSIYNISVSNTVPNFNESLVYKEKGHHQNLVYNINCSDIDGDSITYYSNSSLFTINETNGTIIDNPTSNQEGSYAINVSCGDGNGNVSEVFIYNITNAAPTFNESLVAKTRRHDQDLIYNINCSDINGDTITYS